MADWQEIEQLGEKHRKALAWFDRHTGQTVTWKAMQDHAGEGARLVNQAKGIYKPAYTDYALSVRQTLSGPYDDLEVDRRSDGSWLFSYFQENKEPALRDREATNRGLMKCMADKVPVGVLIQRTPKPGVTYDVLGLAQVVDWQDGYFFLESMSGSVAPSQRHLPSEAERMRVKIELHPQSSEPFTSEQISDTRERAMREVVHRRGQGAFRRALLSAYGSKCAVTGCDAVEALEAAHITPYMGEESNHVQNGILLRADLHSLFDLGLLSIHPETRRVELSKALERTSYCDLHGKTVAPPATSQEAPSTIALQQHWDWCGLSENSDHPYKAKKQA